MRNPNHWLAVAGAIAVGGCATIETGSPSYLRGEWVVEDIGGRGVIDHARATLLFGEDGRLSGNATCNRLIATYRVDGNRIEINAPGLTRMACPPALMDQEGRLVQMLADIATYEIDPTGALILKTGGGSTITARR